MRVHRYRRLALFYFIFSNSDYSVMNDHNHVFLFVFFFFGLSIHCTMEFNWHVNFFITLAKFHFENILNDSDNDEFR